MPLKKKSVKKKAAAKKKAVVSGAKKGGSKPPCSSEGISWLKAQTRTKRDGKFFINKSQVTKRVRRMFLCDPVNYDIFSKPTNHKFPAPPITKSKRGGMRRKINTTWFGDVGCTVGKPALGAATTPDKFIRAILLTCNRLSAPKEKAPKKKQLKNASKKP